MRQNKNKSIGEKREKFWKFSGFVNCNSIYLIGIYLMPNKLYQKGQIGIRSFKEFLKML